MPSDPFLSPPRLLEVIQVAHRLNAGEALVRRLIHSGKLPAIRLGKQWRIDPIDLQAFIDRQRVSVATEEEAIDLRIARVDRRRTGTE